MQDLRVRRAMNHAVDVDELIKQVLKGRASRMCGPMAPANVDYAPAECYKYDLARAQALFKEAGVDPAKLPLTLDTPSGRYPLDKDVSLAIAAQLQRAGLKVNVVVNEWGTHLDKIKNRNTGDMFCIVRQQQDDRREDRAGPDPDGAEGALRGVRRAAAADP
jgi:peptide/nickel transport system substrate-binding protein